MKNALKDVMKRLFTNKIIGENDLNGNYFVNEGNHESSNNKKT